MEPNENNGERRGKNSGGEEIFPEFSGENAPAPQTNGAKTVENGLKSDENPENGAPVCGTKKKKRKLGKIVSTIALCLEMVAVGFFCAYASVDREIRSLIWTKNQIRKNYIEDVTDEEFYGAVFDAVNSLLDSYSQYFSAEEYKAVLESATGRWIGMGITFSTQDGEKNPRLLAIKIAGNSPAERAGIKVGTYILGFGSSQSEITESQDYTDLVAFLDSYGEGETFVLKLRDGETGTPYFKEIAMESFVENYVFYRSKTTAYSFVGANATKKQATDNPLSTLDESTAYIRLTEFNGRAAEEFALAMDVFKSEGKKNLILDLRMNGGGYMDILCEIASYFCKDAKGKSPVVAAAVYKNGRREEFKADGNKYGAYFSSDSKISVLADSDTASASECLIGCMADYGAIGFGDIYLSYRGEKARTYGKGIMQTTYPRYYLSGSDAIKLTTAKIVWPVSGKTIHGVGVTTEDGAKTVSENYEGDREIEEAIAKILGD